MIYVYVTSIKLRIVRVEGLSEINWFYGVDIVSSSGVPLTP